MLTGIIPLKKIPNQDRMLIGLQFIAFIWNEIRQVQNKMNQLTIITWASKLATNSFCSNCFVLSCLFCLSVCDISP